MLKPYAYYLVLIAVCAFAFLCGRRDEKAAALVFIVATIATHAVTSPTAVSFSSVEVGIFIVDLAALAAFTAIALWSDRFWPLWVAGLQLTTLIAHGLKEIEVDLMPQAYAAAARFWVYPIFLILVVGTWRTHRRTMHHRKMSTP